MEPYSPVLKLKPFAQDVWTIDSEIFVYPFPMMMFTVNVPLNARSQVIRLRKGDIMLLGAVQYSEELKKEISALGPVTHLVCPNALHWMWAVDWLKAFPDAAVWAPCGSSSLVQQKMEEQQGRKMEAVFAGEVGDAGWPQEIELVKFPITFEGEALTECVYIHEPTKTAIIIDLLFWFDPALVKGSMLRFMLSFLGVSTEGGSGAMSDVYKPTIKAGKKAACNVAARELLAKKPQRLCMSHGVVSREPVEEMLRKGLFWVGDLD